MFRNLHSTLIALATASLTFACASEQEEPKGATASHLESCAETAAYGQDASSCRAACIQQYPYEMRAPNPRQGIPTYPRGPWVDDYTRDDASRNSGYREACIARCASTCPTGDRPTAGASTEYTPPAGEPFTGETPAGEGEE